MDFNERLARIKALLAERDEIDQQLAEMLVAGPKPISIRDKAVSKKQKVGRSGGCSECGSRGRHFKTCTRSGAPNLEALTPKETRSLTENEYAALRDAMNDRDFMSAKYALTHRLSPREVNIAVRSLDYEDYLNDR